MRGTGSRRVVVQDLFVPEHHTVPSPNPFRPVVELPGRDVHANPMFRGPLASLLISEPAAVCVGIAHAAVDAYIELLTTKHQWGPMSPLRSEVGVFQRLLGEATAYLDTAEAALHQVARIWTDHAERAAETGIAATDEDDRRLILVEQQIIELAVKVVDLVFRTSGSSASNRGQRIERYFRDVNMVRTHITLQSERTWENVGRLRLGMTPGDAVLGPQAATAVFAAFAAARARRSSRRAARFAATRRSPARCATVSASSPLGRNGSARTQEPWTSAAAQMSPATSATMTSPDSCGWESRAASLASACVSSAFARRMVTASGQLPVGATGASFRDQMLREWLMGGIFTHAFGPD